MQTIEMNDFCIRLENLPEFDFYKGDESLFKIKIWLYVNEVIKN